MKVKFNRITEELTFLDGTTTLNSNDVLWHTLEVEMEGGELLPNEHLYVAFSKVDGSISTQGDLLPGKGAYHIPQEVLASAGEWGMQLLIRVYDKVSEKYIQRGSSKKVTFTVEEGLHFDGEEKPVTINSLGSVATDLGIAQDDIEDLQTDFGSLSQRVTSEISRVDGEIADFKEEIDTEVAAFKLDVNGDITNFKTEVQGDVSAFKTEVNTALDTAEATIPLEVNHAFFIGATFMEIIEDFNTHNGSPTSAYQSYMTALSYDFNKIPEVGDVFWATFKTADNYSVKVLAQVLEVIESYGYSEVLWGYAGGTIFTEDYEDGLDGDISSDDKLIILRNGYKETEVDGRLDTLEADAIKYISASVNGSNYELTFSIKNGDGETISTAIIDLPLETMVVGGRYSDGNIVLTLKNGGEVSFPVTNLIRGLINSSEKGKANGVATLDGNGEIPVEQLPETLQTQVTQNTTDINALALMLNNESNTKVTLTMSSSLTLDLRTLYNLENHGGCTAISWGDGDITRVEGKTENEMRHTYASAGTYTVTLADVKDIPLLFREKNVSSVCIGSSVKRIRDFAFNGNPNLKEVTICSETPPTMYASSTTTVIKPFDDTVEKIYVRNNSYIHNEQWNYYSEKLYFDYTKNGENTLETLKLQVAQNTDDISALKATSGGENHADTKVTLTVADNYVLDLRNIFRYENHGGCTAISWGDGAVTEVTGTNEDILKHKYIIGGEYTITLVGIKVLPLVFREKNVSYVVLGKTLEVIDNGAFLGNHNLTEARIYTETPPSFIKTYANDKPFDNVGIKAIYVPEKSIREYVDKWSYYASIFTTDEVLSSIFADKVVTVGVNGDFPTINKAIEYLSAFYPVYKKGGIKCEIKILDGTIINEQIKVERIDLSYISITTDNANNTVQVDVTGWSGVTHDTRGNRPFFSGEYGARLPVIKCLFSCIVPSGGWISGVSNNADNTAVGYFCNRGSMGVIAGETSYNGSVAQGLANVGFENFFDNIIANNNSEIVLRESIARNAGRYGVMSRHISRVSARSADITGCAECAAYADRTSMMDVRAADLSNSKNAIQCYNASVITANETKANNITNIVADAQTGSILNAEQINAQNSKDIFNVDVGGQIVSTSAKTDGTSGTLYNVNVNTLSSKGIIYN
jgi:hypothetical protein